MKNPHVEEVAAQEDPEYERECVLTEAWEMPVFVMVHTIDAAPTTAREPSGSATRSALPARSAALSGLIEIELGDGRQVRVGSDVNLAALRRELAVLRA